MNSGLRSQGYTESQLVRCQECCHGFLHAGTCTFCHKTTQCAPNGDWSQTSTLFVQGNQGGTKEGGPSRDSSFTSQHTIHKKVTDRSNNCPPPRADLLIMSFRCCGRRASGPPAEPQGKEQMALATSSSDTWTGIGRSSEDTSGIAESGWGRGCFSRRVASVSLLGTAILSSENLLPLV